MKMEENFKLSSSRFHGLYRVFSIHKLKAFAYPWNSHATARSKLVKRVQRMLVKLRTQVRHIATRGDHRRAPVRSFLWLTKRM